MTRGPGGLFLYLKNMEPPVEAIAELLRTTELAATRGAFSVADFEHVGKAWSAVAAWLRAWAAAQDAEGGRGA